MHHLVHGVHRCTLFAGAQCSCVYSARSCMVFTGTWYLQAHVFFPAITVDHSRCHTEWVTRCLMLLRRQSAFFVAVRRRSLDASQQITPSQHSDSSHVQAQLAGPFWPKPRPWAKHTAAPGPAKFYGPPTSRPARPVGFQPAHFWMDHGPWHQNMAKQPTGRAVATLTLQFQAGYLGEIVRKTNSSTLSANFNFDI